MHLFDVKTPFLRRERDRRRRPAAGRGPRPGRPHARRPRVTRLLLRRWRVAEGEFHECLNLAALWQLPVLFCCENNLYAMGTALDRAQAQTDLARAGRQLRHAVLAGGRHGRARGRAGGPCMPPRPSAPVAGRTSWSCAPTVSAPTRCTTRSGTGTRQRSRSGSSATRSRPGTARMREAGELADDRPRRARTPRCPRSHQGS